MCVCYLFVCLDRHIYNRENEAMEGSDGEVQVSMQEPDALFYLIKLALSVKESE